MNDLPFYDAFPSPPPPTWEHRPPAPVLEPLDEEIAVDTPSAPPPHDLPFYDALPSPPAPVPNSNDFATAAVIVDVEIAGTTEEPLSHPVTDERSGRNTGIRNIAEDELAQKQTQRKVHGELDPVRKQAPISNPGSPAASHLPVDCSDGEDLHTPKAGPSKPPTVKKAAGKEIHEPRDEAQLSKNIVDQLKALGHLHQEGERAI